MTITTTTATYKNDHQLKNRKWAVYFVIERCYTHAGLHKLWSAGKRLMRTKRIYEDREIWKEYALLSRNGICREYALFGIVLVLFWKPKNQQIMHFCCRKAKNSCFAPKTLIYGIFVANVAKNTTYAF